MKVVKCPQTNEVVDFSNCINCPNYIQFIERSNNRLECEVDWKTSFSNVFDNNEMPA